MADSLTSKPRAIWHRANKVEVPDRPDMIDWPGDTVSKFVAVSNGFMVGRARWHYPTKSWCHKEGYQWDIVFWSVLPGEDGSQDETTVLHEGVRQSYLKACELSLASGLLGDGDRSDLLELYRTLWPKAPLDIREKALIQPVEPVDRIRPAGWASMTPDQLAGAVIPEKAVEPSVCPKCVAVRALGLLACQKHLPEKASCVHGHNPDACVECHE